MGKASKEIHKEDVSDTSNESQAVALDNVSEHVLRKEEAPIRDDVSNKEAPFDDDEDEVGEIYLIPSDHSVDLEVEDTTYQMETTHREINTEEDKEILINERAAAVDKNFENESQAVALDNVSEHVIRQEEAPMRDDLSNKEAPYEDDVEDDDGELYLSSSEHSVDLELEDTTHQTETTHREINTEQDKEILGNERAAAADRNFENISAHLFSWHLSSGKSL